MLKGDGKDNSKKLRHGMPVLQNDGRADGWTNDYVTTSHYQNSSDT